MFEVSDRFYALHEPLSPRASSPTRHVPFGYLKRTARTTYSVTNANRLAMLKTDTTYASTAPAP